MGTATRNTRGSADGPEYALIPLDRIEPDPALSRHAIDQDQLRDLAQSLEQQGQISPIAVRRLVGREKLLIINGERRWRAAYLTTRIRTLSCLIYDDMSDADALLMRLNEDFSHDDLPLLELGEMIGEVLALQDWSIRKLAYELGVPVDRLRRPLAMLRLPPAVQEMVRRGELKESHAYQVSRAPEGERQAIAEKVVRDGLTHEQTLDLVLRRRAAVGIESRTRVRRWRFSAPGDCKVLVITPAGAGRSVVRQALVAVLARLLGARRDGSTDV